MRLASKWEVAYWQSLASQKMKKGNERGGLFCTLPIASWLPDLTDPGRVVYHPLLLFNPEVDCLAPKLIPAWIREGQELPTQARELPGKLECPDLAVP